ncbi:MAG TPA: hypothetical protein VNZ56_13510 [Verrucomicrobiae bacterium]|jgi:hypothetical protein|nr:hypothetical protein [Verrucomicrobiae bacterium]
MRRVRFLVCDLPVALALALFLFAFFPNLAAAKDPPSDVCSLLTPQQLQKTLGQTFGAAQKTSAPPAYMGQSTGTNCRYSDSSGRHEVVLIVYADRSPEEAKQTFEKLSAWYPAAAKPSGIGDSAYIDKSHAIHVLKGSVRYFINAGSSAPDAVQDKQAQELAISVAAQL